MFVFLRNMLQLVLAPTKGWEDVSGTMSDVQTLVKRYMMPTLCLAALSVFVRMIYDSDVKFSTLLVLAFVTFVSFFVSYFFALAMFKSFFHIFCDGVPNERKYTTVISYCMCLLAVFFVVCDLLPSALGLQYLLPWAVALIFWKSDTYLCVKSDKNLLFVLFGILTVIFPPGIIRYFFTELLFE